jgi:mono/diheme cytochrome c family protein
MLAAVYCTFTTGEQQVTTGQGGTRPTLAIWAALVTILAVTGCAREEEPAPPATAPPAAAPPPAAAATAAAPIRDSADPLGHGRYLVETVAGCGNCHTPRLPDGTPDATKNLAGAFVIEEPVFKAYAQNITPDMETGIGSWTEEQIVDAVRNAHRPDGTFMGPPMSFGWYKRMSDTDVRAIAKYVKSVPAVRNEVPASTYQIPGGPPANMYGPIVTSVPDVPKTDIVKYGEYLAGPVGHCMDCHTTYVMGQIDMAQLGRGGNVYTRPFIYDWAAVSANITSHAEAGLGAWTDDEIKRAITEGVSRDGRQLLPFMPYWLYKKMEPSDLDAIVAYLRSLPPLGAAAPAVPE